MAVNFTTNFTIKVLVELTYTVLSVLVIFTQLSYISITATLLNFTFFSGVSSITDALLIFTPSDNIGNTYATKHPKGIIRVTTTLLIFTFMDYWCNSYATQFTIATTDAMWTASFPHM